MLVGDPAQELLAFLAALVVDGQGAGGQIVGDLEHPAAHLAPVGDDCTDVLKHGGELLADAGHGLRGLAVDLQVHQRFRLALADGDQLAGLVTFHRNHRVTEHVDADIRFGQRHGDRVHQERHIVVDDLQHGVRRLPAMALQGRVEQADLRLARLALQGELQHVDRQRRPAFGRVLRPFVFTHALVERAGKGLALPVLRLGQALARGGQDRRQGDVAVACDRGGSGLGRGHAGGSLDGLLGGFLGGRAGGGFAFSGHANVASNAVRPAFSRGPRLRS